MSDTDIHPRRTKRLAYQYFASVMVLSIPFWWLGLAMPWKPLPGVPVSALMFVIPGITAFAFVVRVDGGRGAIRWLAQSWRPPPAKQSGWMLVAVAMPLAILSATFIGMRLAGQRLPPPDVGVIQVTTLLALFFLPAAFEELGWSCFARVTLQQGTSALNASLLVGGIWALWHVIPLLQANRTMTWIAWWCLTTVALRVLLTWIFDHTSRSVIPVALFHASENAAWQSFPVRGSYYDPAPHALWLWGVCAVILVWPAATSTHGPLNVGR